MTLVSKAVRCFHRHGIQCPRNGAVLSMSAAEKGVAVEKEGEGGDDG